MSNIQHYKIKYKTKFEQSQALFERVFANQEIDRKCFIVNVALKRHKSIICRDIMVYAESHSKAKEKVLEAFNYPKISKDIITDNIDDYKIEIEEHKYIILKSNKSVELSKKINEHLVKGWKTLGGVQIAGAGGGESVHSWSDVSYAQSLICD